MNIGLFGLQPSRSDRRRDSIRDTFYLHEHMFSSRTPRLLAAALLDLAEAVLRPVDVDEATGSGGSDVGRHPANPEPARIAGGDLYAELAAAPLLEPHRPHRPRRLRETRARRAGTVSPIPAPCTTPLADTRRARTSRTTAPSSPLT
ncbi:hypothetical protein BDZ31_003267 [Conexibacter arvalis]|uniref:Uncharacterized protein n=1 Tax=Conexibacter arvalis TaxID=912552 RepID=A0A840IFN9_9ACTN|nr:hypothetical protein [Conexibacter arvalis]